MKRTSFVCVAAFAVLAFLVFGAGVADANFKGQNGLIAFDSWTGTSHAILASRSASSSQLFTARMTSSLGGIPFGKSAFKSASRSVALRAGSSICGCAA
jgi:hypothetical protein